MTPQPPHGSLKKIILRLRDYFFSGLLVAAPLVLTFYVAWAVVTTIDSAITGLIPQRFSLNTYMPFHVPGVGLLVAILLFIMIGWLAAGFLGRFLLRMGEKILDKTPIVRGLYSAIKQIFEAVFKRDKTSFRQVVLLEYPRQGVWTIGFVTGVTKGEVRETFQEEMINVFVPTTPNPTSGFFLFLPKASIRPLKMTVEQGIKMIVSAGIVTPPSPPPPSPPQN